MSPRIWALATLASLLSACAVAAVGRPIPPEQVRAIERHVTTLDQLRERLGEPSRRTLGAAGIETWGYAYVSGQPGYLATVFVCDSNSSSRSFSLLVDLLDLLRRPCDPTRLEQELWLVIDAGVVASYTYDSRQVLLEGYERRAPIPRDWLGEER